MSSKHHKSVLQKLPPGLAFLTSCVREMLKLRVGYRCPVDPDECPEQARDVEIEDFLDDDMRILGQHLRDALPSRSSLEFCTHVSALQSALVEWLKPYRNRYDEREIKTLFGIVGLLGNPTPYYKRTPKKTRVRTANQFMPKSLVHACA